jgi:hypothetical protein
VTDHLDAEQIRRLSEQVSELEEQLETSEEKFRLLHVASHRELASLREQLETVSRERDEAVNGIIAQAARREDIELAELRAQLKTAVELLRSAGHTTPGFHMGDCPGCAFVREHSPTKEG